MKTAGTDIGPGVTRRYLFLRVSFHIDNPSTSAPLYCMSSVNGLPLLSGPPPTTSTNRTQNACRRCNKEFIIVFTRSTRWNHCGQFISEHRSLHWLTQMSGYSYCMSCADYQALMPRRGTASGYDQVHVCAFCIEFLDSASPSLHLHLSVLCLASSNCLQQDPAALQAPSICRCVQYPCQRPHRQE
jgi:hypothetical protein